MIFLYFFSQKCKQIMITIVDCATPLFLTPPLPHPTFPCKWAGSRTLTLYCIPTWISGSSAYIFLSCITHTNNPNFCVNFPTKKLQICNLVILSLPIFRKQFYKKIAPYVFVVITSVKISIFTFPIYINIQGDQQKEQAVKTISWLYKIFCLRSSLWMTCFFIGQIKKQIYSCRESDM